MSAVILNLSPRNASGHINWNLEHTAQENLIIMPPEGGESGQREANLITDPNLWNRQSKLGIVCSSSTIFSLPNGGDRSPDAAWIKSDRWNQLTDKQKQGFPPICPDLSARYAEFISAGRIALLRLNCVLKAMYSSLYKTKCKSIWLAV